MHELTRDCPPPPRRPGILEPFVPAPAESNEVSRLAAEGLLRPILPGVYLPAHRTDDQPLRAQALALLIPLWLLRAGGVVAERAAAWLLAGGPAPESIDLYLPPHHTRRVQPPLRVHETELLPDEVDLDGPVPVTVPARTAADLARLLPTAEAIPLLDRLRAGTGLQPIHVLDRLERMPRRRGVPRGRACVQRWSVKLSSGRP